MEAVSLQVEKAALRGQFRDARRKFITAQGRESQALLQQNLARLVRDLSARAANSTQTALYRATAEEAGAELTPYARYFYPRMGADGSLMMLRPRHDDAFELNSFKIPEPIVHSSEPLDPRLPTIVCCPAVALDWEGGRLGMGKGFYDRFFHDHPNALRVGVVFHVQVSKSRLPAESWDAPLDWIVTEKMILRTSKRSS